MIWRQPSPARDKAAEMLWVLIIGDALFGGESAVINDECVAAAWPRDQRRHCWEEKRKLLLLLPENVGS